MSTIDHKKTFFTPNPRQQKFLKRWEKLRKHSLLYYVVVYGVLREGLLSLTLVKLLQYTYDRNSFIVYYITGKNAPIFLTAEIFFWLGCGAVIGLMKHRSFENEYRLLKELQRF